MFGGRMRQRQRSIICQREGWEVDLIAQWGQGDGPSEGRARSKKLVKVAISAYLTILFKAGAAVFQYGGNVLTFRCIWLINKLIINSLEEIWLCILFIWESPSLSFAFFPLPLSPSLLPMHPLQTITLHRNIFFHIGARYYQLNSDHFNNNIACSSTHTIGPSGNTPNTCRCLGRIRSRSALTCTFQNLFTLMPTEWGKFPFRAAMRSIQMFLLSWSTPASEAACYSSCQDPSGKQAMFSLKWHHEQHGAKNFAGLSCSEFSS